MLTIRPPPAVTSARDHGLRNNEHARQVHAQNLVPIVAMVLINRHAILHGVDAGIVDQNVDAAELRCDLRGDVLHRRGVGNVGDERDDAPSLRREFLGRGARSVGRQVDNRHGSTVGC